MATHDNDSEKETVPTGSFDEQVLIERIRSKFSGPGSGSLGIGDDAAILRDPAPLVVTTDILIEGFDFQPRGSWWFAGRKALTANVSDLAAMGAEPDSFLLTLGIPDASSEKLNELIDGLSSKAATYRIALAGGDLSAADRLLIAITAMGRLRTARALLRSDARAGDSIFVSRPLGGPAAGLELLRKGWRMERDGTAHPPADRGYELRELGATLLRAQLDPEAEVELGLKLTEIDSIGACIDLSDGISRDLPRICEASGVGAVIDWERIPVVSDLDRLGAQLGIDPAWCALHGGEEFSLLFTASGGEARLSAKLGRPVYKIGRIESEPGVRLERGGRTTLLPKRGFDHFAES